MFDIFRKITLKQKKILSPIQSWSGKKWLQSWSSPDPCSSLLVASCLHEVSGSQAFSDHVPFVVPVLLARTTLYQEKSMCQISFDQKFGNSFDMKKMATRIFVAIFKANKGSTQNLRNLLTKSDQ